MAEDVQKSTEERILLLENRVKAEQAQVNLQAFDLRLLYLLHPLASAARLLPFAPFTMCSLVFPQNEELRLTYDYIAKVCRRHWLKTGQQTGRCPEISFMA